MLRTILWQGKKSACTSTLAPLLVVGTAVVLAALLRTYQVDLTEFKMDESGWLSVASALLDHGEVPQIGSVDPAITNTMGIHIPPLMAYLMAIPLVFSRDPAFATAFVALLNALTVALLYWVIARYFGRLEGSMAALLYATSSAAIIYSRKIWSNYVLAPFVLLFIIFLLLLIIEGKKRYLAAVLLCLSCAVQLHVSSLPLGLVFVIVAVVFHRRLSWRPALLGVVAGLVIWIPYVYWIIANRTDDLSVVWAFLFGKGGTIDLLAVQRLVEIATSWGSEANIGPAAPAWILRVHDLFWFDYLILAFLVIGLVALILTVAGKGNNSARRIASFVVLLWFFSPLLVATRHSLDVHRFYLLPLLPAVYLLVGVGVAVVWRLPSLWLRGQSIEGVEKGRPADTLHLLTVGWRGLLCTGIAATMVSQSHLFIAFANTIDSGSALRIQGYPPIRYELQAVEQIKDVGEGHQPILVPDDTDTAKVLGYLFDRDQPRFERFTANGTVILPLPTSTTVCVIPATDAYALHQMEQIVPQEYWTRIESAGGELQFALVRIGPALKEHVFGSAGFRVVSGEFDNGMELVGYRLPGEVRAGQALSGLLVFRMGSVPSSTGMDYHFFNHIVDQTDNRVAQQDTSTIPLQGLSVGEARVFPFSAQLPANLKAGPYLWRFGIYDLKTGARSRVTDGRSGASSNAIDFGPISVVGN